MAMNGLSKMAAAAATALLLVLTIVPAAVAVTYTVGDAQQWASGVDYTVWVAGKTSGRTYRVGDANQWASGVDYTDWAAGKTFRVGDTLGGMKLAITVVASSSSPLTPESPPPSDFVAPPPTTGDDSPPSDGIYEADSGSTTPPPPPSNDASSGLISYVVVGMPLVLACKLQCMDNELRVRATFCFCSKENWCVSHSAIRIRHDYCVN
ncbi:unnamed protein product [Arabidopsis arenosa]|uniref:Phytocyanin domain-containing protein n=1 Tax=Arabidopsis arenosa TaxID=38785 RepID=A0A8S2A9G0_ARAAE|nr:unnamed protein product [Arabidopsis arenosa]